MKTILVTGGAGFIGGHVVDRLLHEGYEVVSIDNLNDYYDTTKKLNTVNLNLGNPHFHFFCVDITNEKTLRNVFKRYTFSAVIHLAARAGVRASIEDPLLYEQVNIQGTMHIFELAREFKIKKVIAASSSSIYGSNKKLPFSEADNVDKPISPYAASKKASELFGSYYSQYFDVIMLRFFTVYGPRNRPDMMMYTWIDSIFNDKELLVFGDEEVARDFTYIDDIVDGVLRCLRLSGYAIINLGNSKPVKIRYVLTLLENYIGKTAQVNYLDLPSADVPITYADISRAKKLLDWEPAFTIEEGVKRTVAWYKENELS